MNTSTGQVLLSANAFVRRDTLTGAVTAVSGLVRQLSLRAAVSNKPKAFVLSGSFVGVLTHLLTMLPSGDSRR